jgi:hypothetical protein
VVTLTKKIQNKTSKIRLDRFKADSVTMLAWHHPPPISASLKIEWNFGRLWSTSLHPGNECNLQFVEREPEWALNRKSTVQLKKGCLFWKNWMNIEVARLGSGKSPKSLFFILT